MFAPWPIRAVAYLLKRIGSAGISEPVSVGVVAVVQAEADDLAGVGDRGQKRRARRVVADGAAGQGVPTAALPVVAQGQ